MLIQVHSEAIDPQLWQAMLEGDIKALEELYHRHYKVLYRYGYKVCSNKELAQDCLQEVFFQLWNKREALRPVQSVRFYLMKWLKRELLTNIKKSLKEIPSSEAYSEALGITLSIEDLIELDDTEDRKKIAIQQAMADLSPREREVIYLRFFLELTYDEICQSLNLSYQVVMNYVHRALKALRASNLLNKIYLLMLLSITWWGLI